MSKYAVFQLYFGTDFFGFLGGQAHTGVVSHPVGHIPLGSDKWRGVGRAGNKTTINVESSLIGVFNLNEGYVDFQAIGEYFTDNILLKIM